MAEKVKVRKARYVNAQAVWDMLHNIGGCGAEKDSWAERKSTMGNDYTLCEKIRLMGVKFKPCPFCGEPLDDMPIISSDNGYEVVCPFCGAKGSSDTNPIFAINKWNTRRKKKKIDEYGFNAENFYGYDCIQYTLPITNNRHCCGKCPCREKKGR